MGIVRVNKSEKYFVASNEPFNDERLSWEARGVMGYLLSKPDGWEIKEKDLIKKGPAKLHKITRVIKELKHYGYIRRYRVRCDDGTFDWISETYESPSVNPDYDALCVAEAHEFFEEEEPENRLATSRKSTSGKSMNGSPMNGKSGYIVSTEPPSTKRVSTKTETTSHVEKSNVDFSRGTVETLEQSSFDSLSGTTKNGSTSVESKRPPAKKEPVPKKEPTPRKPDALFDAIAEVWNSAPGMTGKIKQQLTGKIPEKHVDHMANFDVPATPDEVRAFAEWYAKACVGCTMPVSRDKIQTQFYRFRQVQAAKTRKAAPKIRYANGRKLEYNAESMKWYDVGPDDRDYQPQEAYGS